MTLIGGEGLILNDYPPKQKDRWTPHRKQGRQQEVQEITTLKETLGKNISCSASQYFYPVLFVLIYTTGEVILVQD